MRKAGYEVRGMSDFFVRLQQAVRLYENNATAYLRTHPLTGKTSYRHAKPRAGGKLPARLPFGVDFLLVRARLRALPRIPAEAIKDFATLLRKVNNTSRRRRATACPARCSAPADWVGAERELRAARRGRFPRPCSNASLPKRASRAAISTAD